jgi:flagellar biosynthesis chaperone FliJ
VTHATLHKIPDLSTFETDIQTISYARLNQFFDEYSQQIDKG